MSCLVVKNLKIGWAVTKTIQESNSCAEPVMCGTAITKQHCFGMSALVLKVMMFWQVETRSPLSSNMTSTPLLSESCMEIPHVHATKLRSWSGTIFMAISSVRSFAVGGQGILGEVLDLFWMMSECESFDHVACDVTLLCLLPCPQLLCRMRGKKIHLGGFLSINLTGFTFFSIALILMSLIVWNSVLLHDFPAIVFSGL